MLGIWSKMHEVPAGVSLRVVLVRHAEPSTQTKGRCYGKLDVGLGANGRAQADAMACAFSPGAMAKLYTSPRTRAKQTADVLAARVGCELAVDSRWAEIDFGAFEGQTYDEISRRYPEIYEQWMRAPTEVKFPEGESFAELKQRVLAALRTIRSRHVNEAVGVVSHGGVSRIVLAHALRMPDSAVFALGQSYAGVSVVDWYDTTPVLRLLDWTPHPSMVPTAG